MTSSAVMTKKMRTCHKRMKTPGPAALPHKNQNIKKEEKTRTDLAAFGKNSWTSCKQAPQFALEEQQMENPMFNAVCVTKLLNSLEALQPTQAAASKLDTFQLKGLRKILNMSTTYIDRANTNEEVFRRANAAISEGHHRYIRPPSEVLQEKRGKLLGPYHQATS